MKDDIFTLAQERGAIAAVRRVLPFVTPSFIHLDPLTNILLAPLLRTVSGMYH